ncbi:hypothetical protein BHE74_00014037 [Ensete ventricosum]|nr:hypothetical protein BHE74_00014037 [Ensete ventricosum]
MVERTDLPIDQYTDRPLLGSTIDYGCFCPVTARNTSIRSILTIATHYRGKTSPPPLLLVASRRRPRSSPCLRRRGRRGGDATLVSPCGDKDEALTRLPMRGRGAASSSSGRMRRRLVFPRRDEATHHLPTGERGTASSPRAGTRRRGIVLPRSEATPRLFSFF